MKKMPKIVVEGTLHPHLRVEDVCVVKDKRLFVRLKYELYLSQKQFLKLLGQVRRFQDEYCKKSFFEERPRWRFTIEKIK